MSMRCPRARALGRIAVLAGALGPLLVAPAPVAADPCIMSPFETLIGPLQIKGRRYVDGAETKVKCRNGEGHTLDSTTCGTKTFQLVSAPDCTIFADVPGGVLTFTGNENRQEKNTLVKPRYVFGGAETGGQVDGVAEGVMKGRGETGRHTFLKDKGTISYAWVNGASEQVIFVGQYKAKYPHPQP